MKILLILPHQLYKDTFFPNDIKEIILYEHPHYFKEYDYNKKKLVLHKGSMEYYKDYLKDLGYKVKYVDYDEKYNFNLSDKDEGYYFDPIDNIKGLPKHFEMLESK